MSTLRSEALYRYVDFHSHVLPAVDDGSADTDMSCAMLNASREQGVSAMVATPHFYAEQECPADFLSRRARSVERLLTGGYDVRRHPAVFLGAEVAYFPGIAHCAELEQLCVVGTGTVLIEMPFNRWSAAAVDEIIAIRVRRGLQPVLAHVDRYAEMRDRALLETLAAQGVLLQINMSALDRVLSRRYALGLWRKEVLHLLGSDCHNMSTRAPKQARAWRYLAEEVNGVLLDHMAAVSRYALDGAVTLEEMAATLA